MQIAVDARSWRSVSGRLPERHYGASPETSLQCTHPVQVNECQRLSEDVSENLRLCGDAVMSPSQMEPDPIISDDWSAEDAYNSRCLNLRIPDCCDRSKSETSLNHLLEL